MVASVSLALDVGGRHAALVPMGSGVFRRCLDVWGAAVGTMCGIDCVCSACVVRELTVH